MTEDDRGRSSIPMHTICVVGTGYVGLVTGACLAELGNHVTCLDVVPEKIARLQRGDLPIYEPGLDRLVARAVAAGRLRFTTDYAAALAGAAFIFIAVNTPARNRDDHAGGTAGAAAGAGVGAGAAAADMSYVERAARSI